MVAKKTTIKKAQDAPVADEQAAVIETTPVEEVKPVKEKAAVKAAKRELKPDMYVTVRNGVNGTLVYKSNKTGERFVWQAFGDEQDMELQELKNAKNSSKAFFENNWFLIDDPDVIAYLGLERVYDKALKFGEFDGLFDLPADELEARLNEMTDAQKRTLLNYVKEQIGNGNVDSLKTINVLEKALHTELVER